LENATEKLSHLLELEIEEVCKDNVKEDIISTTVLVDRRLLALFAVLNDEVCFDTRSCG
jgi:hypothetical protein